MHLPLRDIRNESRDNVGPIVCELEPDADPEICRDGVLETWPVTTVFAVQLGAPLPQLLREVVDGTNAQQEAITALDRIVTAVDGGRDIRGGRRVGVVASPGMRVAFRIQDERKRICRWDAVRGKRTRVPGAVVGYGNGPPHDLVQYVVEAATNYENGFWGLVARGATFKSTGRRRTKPGRALIAAHRRRARGIGGARRRARGRLAASASRRRSPPRSSVPGGSGGRSVPTRHSSSTGPRPSDESRADRTGPAEVTDARGSDLRSR